MNYYPFHIGDYIAATRHLSWDEDAAYRRLLDWCYANEKPLPLDESKVCRLVVAASDDQRHAVTSVLSEFFYRTDDGWRHSRVDDELASIREKQEAVEERDEHEKTRQQKHRERRAALFARLAEVGVFPAWNAKTGELQRLILENCDGIATGDFHSAVTAPVTATVTPETKTPSSLGQPATAIPTPTPTPIPTPIEKKEERAQAPLPDWVPAESWDGYEDMRKKICKPMTPRARALVLKKLDAMRGDGIDIAEVLDRSTANAWVDVWRPDPKPGQSPAKTAKPGSDEYAQAHRAASWWREAGFSSVWEAVSSRCFHHNAAQFRGGQRIEVAA